MPTFLRDHPRAVLYDADDPPAGDGDDPEPTDPGGRLDPDRWVAKFGDEKAALARMAIKLDQVEADNKAYRDQIKALQGQVPGEDAVVLTGEEAARYQELTGEDDLSAVAERLEAGREAEAELGALQQEAHYREVAKAAGITNVEAFVGLASEDETYALQGEGEEQQAVVIIEEDGDETTVPLAEYERLKPYHGALFAAGEQPPSSPQRRPYVPQPSATANPPNRQVTQEEIDKEVRRRHGHVI